jgi:hypothetical protein
MHGVALLNKVVISTGAQRSGAICGFLFFLTLRFSRVAHMIFNGTAEQAAEKARTKGTASAVP